MMSDTPGGEIVVYEASDGVRVEVRLERETVWLTQQQMAELFGRERSVITKHVHNVFKEGELEEESNVQNLHIAGSDKPIRFFNLDVIISVGYRVKSPRGIQFRIWATRTIRDHLLQGYTLNEQRLRERGLKEIEQAVGLMARMLTSHALVTDEGRVVLEIVQKYVRTWRLLVEFDERRLPEVPKRPMIPAATLSLEKAYEAIRKLREELKYRGEAGDLFGQEHGGRLAGIIGAIEQTFDEKPLYPSVQVRAAHLIYFIIKDHPFADGNKRIGTLLFLEYLQRNRLMIRPDGVLRLSDNAMVALALLIAESEPGHKDLMICLILNLIGDEPS